MGEHLILRWGTRKPRTGYFLLDEPEAALSVRGCMALVARIVDLVGRSSKFVIATHSPILLAVPGATILQIDDEGHLERVAFGRKHHEVREHATRGDGRPLRNL